MKALIFGLFFLFAAFSAPMAQNSEVENEGADCPVTITGNGAISANSNLPDPFAKMNGQRMTTKDEWKCRRQEIRKLMEKTVYGEMRVTPFSATTGTVSNTSISVTVNDNNKTATFTASVDLPSGSGPFPAMIIYGGFGGPSAATLKNQGVAVITFDPAKGGAEGGSRSNKTGAYYTLYGGNSNLGILAAQAWAVSRIIDVIQKSDGKILKWDAIGVTGCSRYGKGSFAAGVFDQRMALTMPIESGTGGVPVMRSVNNEAKQTPSSAYGEQPWLGDVFSTFQNSPNTLPGDMHWAVAMVAPRGLLILDNPHIANLGPRSAHLSALAGAEVYKALGYGGNITYFSNSADGGHCTFQPEFNTPLTNNINKFLKKQGSAVGGDPTINPRSGVTGSTSMINWTTPSLSGTYVPGGGCEGFSISVSAAPATGGTVTSAPEGSCYAAGSQVTLTAEPKEGWAFDSWSGDASGTAASTSVTMNANKTVTAKFKLVGDGTENLVKNGTFSGTTNWTLNQGANYGNSAATISASSNKATINITTAGAEKYQPQLVQTGIALEQGMKYRLTFKASAAAARTMEVLIQLAGSPYTSYAEKDFNLTATEQDYTLEFEMTAASDPSSQLAFNVGGNSTQNVTISDVKLIYIAEITPTPPTSIALNTPLTHFSVRALSGGALRIEANAPTVVEIFDIKGNKAANLNVSGSQTVKLSLPSGVYFAKARGMRNVMFVQK